VLHSRFNDPGFACSIIHQDQFDTIDLSDNEIVKLENMPYLNRLGTLIINNNRITRINPNIGGQPLTILQFFQVMHPVVDLMVPFFLGVTKYNKFMLLYFAEYLPKLHTLVLINNRLVNLAEIDPLASLPKLHFLSLLDNNITKKPNYRLYVIHKLKSLRVLDFKKVKGKVRLLALPNLLRCSAVPCSFRVLGAFIFSHRWFCSSGLLYFT
jgi:U2 small nuclear ribonucleoprotein A'